MTNRICWVMLAMVGAILAGCGKSDEKSSGGTATAAAAGVGDGSGQPAKQVDSSTPKAAVTAFFAALRDSDEQTVAALLTEKAREESEKNNVAIDPPQDPTATFAVGEVEYVEANGAYVSGSWTEKTENGNETIQIVWVLRKEAGGWRIAGLHARSNDEMVVLNFEDPEEMHQRRIEAEQGIQPGGQVVEQVPAGQGVQPGSPPTGPIHSAQQPAANGDYGTYR